MSKIVNSKPRNAIPGDNVRILTAPATDIDGTVWASGTEFCPLSAGRDNTIGRDEQRVNINGRDVVFAREVA